MAHFNRLMRGLTEVINDQDAKCSDCGWNGVLKYHPCGHVVCSAHHEQTTREFFCSFCNKVVETSSRLPRIRQPVDINLRIEDSPKSADNTKQWANDIAAAMNGYGAPNGDRSTGHNNLPFYRGEWDRQQQRGQRDGDENAMGGPRYVPPHLRDEEPDIIRPESSMSNMTHNTFATQAPAGNNYSYGPAQLTQSMSAYDPFGRNPFTSSHAPQPRPYMGGADFRSGAPGGNRSYGRNTHNSTAPVSGHQRSNYQRPSHASGPNNNSFAALAPVVMAPNPVRRDSGAGTQTRAEYLAMRIRQGHADDPFDPDYGNPGPTRRPPPAPKQIPLPIHTSPSENPRLPIMNGKRIEENTEGNTKAFLNITKVQIPAWLPEAINNDTPPTLEQAFVGLPFIEACRYAVPSTAGVVKIISIPYATSRAEVNAFLGKNVQIVYQPAGTGFQAVHIIMDRHSGKTMDAFVECSTQNEAIWIVNQFQKRVVEKRPPKLGGRVVEVALSTQDELMATLFPRAKKTTWENGVPVIDPKREEYYPGVYSEGFKGFLQDDEIYHMYQHAEKPQRSPFVTRCMVRHYEYMITTMYKYPWHSHQHAHLQEREMFFDACHHSIIHLIQLLRRIRGDTPDTSKPTINTLSEFATAVFVCPGFTDQQKVAVRRTLEESGFGRAAEDSALGVAFGGSGRFAAEVPFRALVVKPGVSDDVVKYFITLLSTATGASGPNGDVRKLSLADLHAKTASGQGLASLPSNTNKFGNIDIDYTDCRTLADAGRAELHYLEEVLGRVLPSSRKSSGLGSKGSGSGSGAAGSGGHGSRVSSLQLGS